ncbi:GrpB family protein [Brevundimonas sp.]|uniref:GrpB family protein n=1 Tax=Brevundimonas sp. TaxID=1871086 RepID=UPI001D5BA01C|nr:GrpB family protein [Brevundimonas sp.]MBA3999381.1 hypothetical protein [Brevundimonas sp.]
MATKIEIRPWSPAWAVDFAIIADDLSKILGKSVRLEHIGSTAIAGLAAKPVIDVVVGVPTMDDVATATTILARNGFAPGIPAAAQEQTGFVSKPETSPAVNVHVVLFDGSTWRDLVNFRDRLREDPELAGSYEALKRELAAKCRDLNAYTRAKSAFVTSVINASDHDQLLRHQRAELRDAEGYRGLSIGSQLTLTLLAAASIWVDDGALLAVIGAFGFLSAASMLWFNHLYRSHRSAGEQVRRLLQIVYGLGWPVANTALVCSECRASTKKLSTLTLKDYFATRAANGQQKLAEMVEESAFFTGRLHEWSGSIMWLVTVVPALAVFVGWAVWGWRQTGDVQIVAVRVILTFSAFLLTSGATAAALSHRRAAAVMLEIRQRLLASRGKALGRGRVVQLMTDYNAAVESAPLPTPYLYKALAGGLNRAWAKYKKDSSLGQP